MGFNNTSRKTVGTFTLVGENTRHEYVECPEWLAAAFSGFPVAIPCLDGTFRACRVSKTRAYVVVDETETGEPVVETWPIRGHHVKVGSWDCLLPAQVSDFS